MRPYEKGPMSSKRYPPEFEDEAVRQVLKLRAQRKRTEEERDILKKGRWALNSSLQHLV